MSGNWTATNRYDYDSWGKVSTSQTSKNSIGYTGQRLDNETGLMALGNGASLYRIEQENRRGQAEHSQL